MNPFRLSAVAVCSYWLGRQGHPMVKRLKNRTVLLERNFNTVRDQRDWFRLEADRLKDELWADEEASADALARAMAMHPSNRGRQINIRTLGEWRVN